MANSADDAAVWSGVLRQLLHAMEGRLSPGTDHRDPDAISQKLWTAVDRYFEEELIPPDATLAAVLAENRSAGLPEMDVAPNQGKFLHLLARIQGARRILEIGTLGGYSTIWLARALPAGGRLVTLEFDPQRAKVAAANIERAGLSAKVEIHVGPAVESLAALHREGEPPFDFIFIDADKPSNPAYLEWSLRLSRPGTIILGDNVVRDGAVIDSASGDAKIQGVRRFVELMAVDDQLDATALQTVGSKGYDGFTLALVKENAK
jgi:predicted O-methyltransferase YrrM